MKIKPAESWCASAFRCKHSGAARPAMTAMAVLFAGSAGMAGSGAAWGRRAAVEQGGQARFESVFEVLVLYTKLA
ncbi:hypothetical protein [Comamonas testosteroni]|uniref:hypothetical protein n=1 Tax=Comamonas testosteroni TaxID=285 RepID=UPI00391C4B8E